MYSYSKQLYKHCDVRGGLTCSWYLMLVVLQGKKSICCFNFAVIYRYEYSKRKSIDMGTVMKSVTLLLFSSLLIHESICFIGFGKCPEPPVVNTFSVEQYTGTWYEYQRFPVPFEFLVKCAQANYRLTENGTVFVNNTGIQEFSIAGLIIYRKKTSVYGLATIPDPAVPAKLVVTFSGQAEFTRGNYWVLATDYNTYSLVYSCAELPLGILHYEAAWILTRERGTNPGNIAELWQILRANNVNPENFFDVSQQNCDTVHVRL